SNCLILNNVLPDTLFIKCLTSLTIENSNIKTIPESIKECVNLTFINISGTKIKESEFKNISLVPNLKNLIAKNLNLKKFPKYILDCKYLNLLNLSSCNIEGEIPNNLFSKLPLIHVNLSSNGIKNIPNEKGKLLTVLNM